MSQPALSRTALARYGALRMPLAMLELPLFVLLPAFYVRETGMALALIGTLLFAGRLIDALADPVIGMYIDRSGRRFDERRWVLAGLPVLAVGFIAIFMPPRQADSAALWLALFMLPTYLAWSVTSIAHQAWGAALADRDDQRARVTAMREAFGLAGVIIASVLLAWEDVRLLLASFVTLTLVGAALLIRAPLAPRKAAPAAVARVSVEPMLAWRAVAANREFRRLIAAFMLNGIATAIPATLVLFFVQDVLGADSTWTAVFLTTYFLSGAIGMPLWISLSSRIGLRNAWLLGIGIAVFAFIGALWLGHSDQLAFLLICMLTGLALGSDLALPVAMLSGVIARAGHANSHGGTYFGIWNLATKANLALAAGLALPMLSWAGYSPGQSGQSTLALSLAYAALPCALKLTAGLVLLSSSTTGNGEHALAGNGGSR
jgi:GPH family glycoside/pentoside/hexuronide:cation symporter